MTRYKFPKFKLGASVKTANDTVGSVESISYIRGTHFYFVCGAWYTESELIAN